MEGFLQNAEAFLAIYSMRVVGALTVLVIGWIAAKVIRNGVRKALERGKLDATLVPFLTKLVYYAVIAFVGLAVLRLFGVETTSFIAVLGAAGLAVGLALQGTLSNFAAGVMLLIFRPFKVGDFIEAAGTSGVVEELLIFSTKMRSPDNKQLYVPNGSIISGTIVNYSAKDRRRVDLVFGCGYGDDIKKVKALLEQIVTDNPLVLDDPAPTVGVLELGDNSVNFAVRPWVNTPDYWDAYFQINQAVKQGFDEAGISIPFPQRDVHLIPNEAA